MFWWTVWPRGNGGSSGGLLKKKKKKRNPSRGRKRATGKRDQTGVPQALGLAHPGTASPSSRRQPRASLFLLFLTHLPGLSSSSSSSSSSSPILVPPILPLYLSPRFFLSFSFLLSPFLSSPLFPFVQLHYFSVCLFFIFIFFLFLIIFFFFSFSLACPLLDLDLVTGCLAVILNLSFLPLPWWLLLSVDALPRFHDSMTTIRFPSLSAQVVH